ncbi:MAG: hypothetical protein AB1490_11445 [Pseudomonadota bacterium]
MSIKTKTAAALAVLALATSLAIPASEAQARGWGLAAGLIGGAIVAGAIASSANANTVYVDGYRRCRFVRQYDQFGYYVGTTKVCNYY